jgi:hypothetical protein
MITLTGSYTLEKMFEIPKVKSAFKKALKSRCINSNVKVKCVTHYDNFKNLKMGNIALAGRIKSVFNTKLKLTYRVPIAVAYNRENLGSNLNLKSKELKKIIICAIKDEIYEPWNRTPKISAGVVRGMTRRALALCTGLSYDRVAQVTEHRDIVKLGDTFVNELINKSEFDLVLAPLPLMENYFTGKFEISKINGKKPRECGYTLNDYLSYASYNGEQLETQEAIADALNDVQLRKELKKIGIIHSNSRRHMEDRPDIFGPRL